LKVCTLAAAMTKRKPAPSAPSADTVQLNLRVPSAVAEKLSQWVDALNARASSRGVRWNRNAVLLALVERALNDRAMDGEP
jgi:hypothetical protein